MDASSDRLEVMDHFLEGHINRVFLTQNNHPQGITHKD